MNRRERRYKVLSIPADRVFDLLPRRKMVSSVPILFVPEFNLPEDCEVEQVRHDEFGKQLRLLLWSKEFEIVPDGEIPPKLEQTWHQVVDFRAGSLPSQWEWNDLLKAPPPVPPPLAPQLGAFGEVVEPEDDDEDDDEDDTELYPDKYPQVGKIVLVKPTGVIGECLSVDIGDKSVRVHVGSGIEQTWGLRDLDWGVPAEKRHLAQEYAKVLDGRRRPDGTFVVLDECAEVKPEHWDALAKLQDEREKRETWRDRPSLLS